VRFGLCTYRSILATAVEQHHGAAFVQIAVGVANRPALDVAIPAERRSSS